MHAKSFLMGLSLSVAFVAGCVAQSVMAPIPPARAGADVQRWEYLCIDESGGEEVTEQANRAGAQGWELVAAGKNTRDISWCFKRPR